MCIRDRGYAGDFVTVAMKSVLLEHFIARHRRDGTTPKRLSLDVDSTDDETHGQQEFTAFNGFYDSYVYLQLLVTTADGDLLHVALVPPKLNLRARAVMAIDEVVTRLRQEWPHLELRLRADNGFATPAMYSLCEKHRVEYFINAGSHAVFQEASTTVAALALAEKEYQPDESRTVMVYAEMKHQAKSWEVERRIVIKAQRTPVGPDTRFLVTNSKLTPKGVYEEYSQRGQAENFIKDFKRMSGGVPRGYRGYYPPEGPADFAPNATRMWPRSTTSTTRPIPNKGWKRSSPGR